MTGLQPPPLAGITVIDLGQVYQGPYATLMMAKAGARVIKVEPPGGESARRRAGVGEGATVPFCMLNANKASVVLNLKTQRGREVLLAMVARADVLLENFAPGVMDRLGLGWPLLHARNPRLVYASGTGFGLSGPDRDALAMDLTVQAMSGVMSVTGFPDGPPLKAGPAFVDFHSGAHLYAGIVTALLARERSGVGGLVEVAMQDTVIPTLASNLGLLHRVPGAAPARTGNRHGGMAIAPYNVYACADGHIAIICVVEEHWTALKAAMGNQALDGDPRFATNPIRVTHMEVVDGIVGAWAAGLTRQAVFDLAKRHRFPCAPVRDLTEVMTDPHLLQRGMLEQVDHPQIGPVVLPTSPLRFHGAEPVPSVPSQHLGAAVQQVFGDWLGLPAEEVAALRRDGGLAEDDR